MRALVVAVLLVGALGPRVAAAQVYHWVDEEGTIHYATGLERVPERFRATARELRDSPRPAVVPPPPAAADTRTTIPFTAGAPILVNARVNRAGPLTLILDTGADRTMISPAALQRIGVHAAVAGGAEIKGVTGTSQAAIVWVESVEVGTATAGPLAIVAHDADLRHADGLLGRDFLSRFSVTIDASASIVTLTPK